MKIHKIISEAMKRHKPQIQLLQWALTSSVASLIYTEYIRRIKQKQTPVRMIQVPAIKTVDELLAPGNDLMDHLCTTLIEEMKKEFQNYFPSYLDSPDMVLFEDDENVEVLKTIFELYIVPNIGRSISSTIRKKFALNDEKQQLIRESNEIDLFDRQYPLAGEYFDYLIHQSVLQLLIILPTVNSEDRFVEDNTDIILSPREILAINSESAICPIYFDDIIIKQSLVIDTLSFVTNTSFTAGPPSHPDSYVIKTGPFNQAALIKICGFDHNTIGDK